MYSHYLYKLSKLYLLTFTKSILDQQMLWILNIRKIISDNCRLIALRTLFFPCLCLMYVISFEIKYIMLHLSILHDFFQVWVFKRIFTERLFLQIFWPFWVRFLIALIFIYFYIHVFFSFFVSVFKVCSINSRSILNILISTDAY